MGIELLTVKNDKERRFKDIFTMLEVLDKNTLVSYQLVLKSSLALMLYNVVEGTMSNLLIELFDVIIRKNKSIDNLPNKLQNLFFEYHLKKIGKKPDKLKEICCCDERELCNITYLEISKYLNLFSGNLDARSIRSISEKLGINLPESTMEPCLVKIKNIRNALAHGEKEFSKACQDITLDEMKKICDKVNVYLDSLISAYEDFFDKL